MRWELLLPGSFSAPRCGIERCLALHITNAADNPVLAIGDKLVLKWLLCYMWHCTVLLLLLLQ